MTEDLAAEFRRFAEEDCSGRIGSPSPLYEHLSHRTAEDPATLRLAAAAREEQPAPMALLAAVQYLLFENPNHQLAAFYPSVDGATQPVDDTTYPAFKEFCRAHESEIRNLVSTRRVQTNTVRRSACLLPAFEHVSRVVDRAPLGLVEIGASAGLNLLWDRYGYSYDGQVAGDNSSPVRTECELRGEIAPSLPDEAVPIGSRRGVDLHPLDVTDDEDGRWLDALIWPEHQKRRANLRRATEIAADQPPTIHEGDVLDTLERVVEEIPANQPVCLYNTYVLYQLSDAQRADLYDLVSKIGAQRDIYWLSCEWAMDIASPVITLHRYENGVHSAELLARFHGHGEWLEWLRR